MKQIHVLYAVLNWGLGHATRSVPLIQGLVDDGYRVTVASDGDALALLKDRFPNLTFLELPSYGMNYKGGWSLPLVLGLRILVNRGVIKQEQRQIADFATKHQVEKIFSDARLGAFVTKIPCVFISHQLLPAPFFISNILKNRIANLLRPYSEIWIPDTKDRTLSGRLSHWQGPQELKFIGPISQFNTTKAASLKDYVFFIASGPSRHRMHQVMQFLNYVERHKIRGVIAYHGTHDFQNVHVLQNPKVETLEKHLSEARWVVANCGYTTLMDLKKVNREDAILFPTTGQPEQQYLTRLHGYPKNIRKALQLLTQSMH